MGMGAGISGFRELGIKRVRAQFIPTAKNAPARDLLDRLGFEAGNLCAEALGRRSPREVCSAKADGFRSFPVRPMDYPDYIRVRTEQK